MQDNKNIWIIGGVAFLFFVCCVCIIAAVGGSSLLRIYSSNQTSPVLVTTEAQTGVPPKPFPEDRIAFPTATRLNQEIVEP